MSKVSQQRRQDLRERLLVAAGKRISENGLVALRMRDVARDADCALGAIYTIFADMEELVFQTNIRVFLKMSQSIAIAVEASKGGSPHDRMMAMSLAYYRFAQDNLYSWQALFETDLTSGQSLPAWYLDALKKLMSYISVPVQELTPKLSAEENSVVTRSLFSAIHGIVILSISNRPSGVQEAEIPQAFEIIIKSYN